MWHGKTSRKFHSNVYVETYTKKNPGHCNRGLIQPLENISFNICREKTRDIGKEQLSEKEQLLES